MKCLKCIILFILSCIFVSCTFSAPAEDDKSIIDANLYEEINERKTPITLEELEAAFNDTPSFPALQLQTADVEVNLKADMLELDVKAGTTVKTKGYYSIGDGGQAVYEIMTYDDWWEQLPIDVKLVAYHNDRIGVNPVFYKNPVDDFGHHRLKNGLVAKLLPNLDGYVRTEQWGLFEGRKDNCRAVVHCFAYNTRNAKILFPKGKVYIFYNSWKTEKNARADEIFYKNKDFNWWIKPEVIATNGNEYAAMHGTRHTQSPIVGNARNMEIYGNGSTLKWGDGSVTSSFGIIESGGYIDGLKIDGLILDGNWKEQFYNKDSDGNISYDAEGIASQVVTRAHGFSFFSAIFNPSLIDAEGYVKDGNNDSLGIKYTEIQNYLGVEDLNKTTFNNVEITNCTIKNTGTYIPTADSGGDSILLINPIECNNLNIHNNKFYNWGRWVWAVDLGGNGERFYNNKFVQNICIQDDTNYNTLDGSRYRGLGWIDFEARKCFTNLDVSENYVHGINGWAFNGNGKISENVRICNNFIQRPPYPWRSAYPYVFEFYWVFSKNLNVRNNHIEGGSLKFGRNAYDMKIINNKFISTGVVPITNPYGNVVIKNNSGEGVRSQLWSFTIREGDLTHINDPASEYYIPSYKYQTTVLFENNSGGGIAGNSFHAEPGAYVKTISLIFKNNKYNRFDVNCNGLKEYYFTVDQLNGNFGWAARGCKTYNKVYSIDPGFAVPGGLYYKVGDLVTDTIKDLTWVRYPEYFIELFPIGETHKNGDLYCTKEGVFPFHGAFLMTDHDYLFTPEKEVSAGTFYYTKDNLYYTLSAGILGSVEPTHEEGVELCGTVELLRIAPIARYEIRPSVPEVAN